MPVKPVAVIDQFAYERPLWSAGLQHIAGVDEAGRGPLAGPVVAAAAILPPHWGSEGLPPELAGLNDSKQLTEIARENFFQVLTSNPCIRYAIAIVQPEIIDRINILQATHLGMNQALRDLKPAAEHVLVDGTRVKSMRLPQTPIVKGDSLSFSIAAASVLAKVTRDRIMTEMDLQWPAYGFAVHKGYPTPQHLAALQREGPCPIHRMSFAPLKSMATPLSIIQTTLEGFA